MHTIASLASTSGDHSTGVLEVLDKLAEIPATQDCRIYYKLSRPRGERGSVSLPVFPPSNSREFAWDSEVP